MRNLALKILKWKLLVHYLEADKEGSRLRRSVEIARIAEFPFIQVFLETVEDILYTRIQLKLDAPKQLTYEGKGNAANVYENNQKANRAVIIK